MIWMYVCFGMLWGAATGSYLGAAAWRLPRRIPLWEGRSHCPGCGAMVPGYRNVPVVSFLLQRGRASCCGGRLARRYLLLEASCAAAGAAFAAGVFSVFGDAAPLVMFAAAVVALVVPSLVSVLTADRRRSVDGS
jgi:leader peptidase (prepilin peptidase)/N-methyltransferase